MALRYPRLGEQITRLTRSLSAVKDWNKQYTMAYVSKKTGYSTDMIYRWQQGHRCPPPETIKILAQIAKREAGLDREWGESFLNATHHPDTAAILYDLWGPKEIRSIDWNLPPLDHTELIGRQAEVTRLLELLSPQHASHLISVDGTGGVGKTALVLEVAYQCKLTSTGEAPNPRAPSFDAIIFVSAKQHYLTPGGILARYEAQRTLQDIFRQVAQTLNRFEITHATSNDQPTRVREALARQRTFLIVDNLETMEDKHEIVSFLYDLPPSVKVIITTRERALFSPIRLEQLTEEAALHLIAKEAREKGVEVNKEKAIALYRCIGGIPAALVYAVGQISSGYSEMVLDKVLRAGGDIARFCFEESVEPLRGNYAHKLMMAIAMFPEPPLREAIAHAAGLTSDPIALEDGLARLQQLSLLSQQDGRYRMLPLTREYALVELATHPEFEREARKRWLEWYNNFIEEYGGYDWAEWHIHFDRVEEEWENLLAVFDWYASHEQYHEIRAFWQAGGVFEFTIIYGHWDDYLTWISWLIQASERRGDWATLVEAMTDIGYILTLMGKLEESSKLLRRAWDLHEHAPSVTKINTAQNIARLCIYNEQFTDASNWLNQAERLLEDAQLTEPERTRRQIITQYYRGRIYFKQQDYELSELCFKEMIVLAQAIGWQRMIIYAQNYLADIFIERGRFDEAESLLQIGLTLCERNKDKRRTANYKSSLAYLYLKRKTLNEVHRWAEEALDGFERLGMQLEAKEMRELLEQI